MEFSANLKHLRKLKRVNQGTLAHDLGLSNTQISNWENDIALPELQTMLKISNYFGISVNDLLESNLRTNDIIIEDTQNAYIPPGKCEFCSQKDETIKALNRLTTSQQSQIDLLNARIKDLEGSDYGQKRKVS